MKSVKEEILDGKVIIIVRGVGREKLLSLSDALIEGGITLMEITYTAHDESSDERIADDIRALTEHTAGRMYIGAGTVTRERQVELTLKAGGKFIISPDTDPSIIRATKDSGLISIPGALTPSEITAAYRYGADFVKLFPANQMGPSYLKAIKAPLSHIPILAVGGVNENTIPDYLAAGATGFGIGTNFGDPEYLKCGRFDKITEAARKYVEAARGNK